MSIEKIINDAWEIKDQINQNSDQKIKDTINNVINPNTNLLKIKKNIFQLINPNKKLIIDK